MQNIIYVPHNPRPPRNIGNVAKGLAVPNGRPVLSDLGHRRKF